ncbi:hypothetical protein EC973_001782 [Apophysomyces ossiformis]|uniref:Homeobox domain-containing protein n=1 Tax=Apophysomyces ossiformis TaxID=679940 RepID=A0A8H7BHG9_9FUNG|nr:hypothetical protein EC973_001782 [Apophysomyces ossiformis]
MEGNSMSTKARRRARTTPEQAQLLDVYFRRNPAPSKADLQEISQKVGIDSKSLQFWFQNRRAKEKKMQRSERSDLSDTPKMSMPMEQRQQQQQQHQPEISVPVYYMQQSSSQSSMLNPNFSDQQPHRYFDYPATAQQAQQRLPSLASVLPVSIMRPHVASQPSNRPGNARIPIIPYYFHHPEFGIESHQLQWMQKRPGP